MTNSPTCFRCDEPARFNITFTTRPSELACKDHADHLAMQCELEGDEVRSIRFA